ncbi:MAG: hypothetical protein GY742_17710 [Hyphomicrobiales bacterium]|nr:hypothetical protein [Hyphomicrobiales bacterium]
MLKVALRFTLAIFTVTIVRTFNQVKAFVDAQAFVSVPSIEKCSPVNSCLNSSLAIMAFRKARATTLQANDHGF